MKGEQLLVVVMRVPGMNGQLWLNFEYRPFNGEMICDVERGKGPTK